MLRRRLNHRLGEWNATLIAASHIVVMSCVAFVLPDVNEVREGFPATLLWQFRMASLGGRAIMWATFGLFLAS
jgi:predicted cobalt transporter CbtA